MSLAKFHKRLPSYLTLCTKVELRIIPGVKIKLAPSAAPAYVKSNGMLSPPNEARYPAGIAAKPATAIVSAKIEDNSRFCLG